MSALNVRHTGIVVNDLESCVAFWTELMGFTIQSRADEHGPHIDGVMEEADVKVTTVKMTAADNSMIELLKFTSKTVEEQWNGGPFTTGITHIALTVSNLDETYQKLKKHGVRFHAPPQLTPNGYAKMTYCRGPEGLILELVEVCDNG